MAELSSLSINEIAAPHNLIYSEHHMLGALNAQALGIIGLILLKKRGFRYPRAANDPGLVRSV